MIKQLKEWEGKTNVLVEYFVDRYFGKRENEFFWIAEEVGGVLAVNDYFFNLDDIVEFIKYHYSKDMMFKYYQYNLDYHMQKTHKKNDYLINIKNYKKMK